MGNETGKPSEFCATLISKWVAVDEPILNLNKNEGIGEDGGPYSSTILRRMTATTYANGCAAVPRRQSISEREATGYR